MALLFPFLELYNVGLNRNFKLYNFAYLSIRTNIFNISSMQRYDRATNQHMRVVSSHMEA